MKHPLSASLLLPSSLMHNGKENLLYPKGGGPFSALCNNRLAPPTKTTATTRRSVRIVCSSITHKSQSVSYSVNWLFRNAMATAITRAHEMKNLDPSGASTLPRDLTCERMENMRKKGKFSLALITHLIPILLRFEGSKVLGKSATTSIPLPTTAAGLGIALFRFSLSILMNRALMKYHVHS